MPLNLYCTVREIEAPDFPVRRLNGRDRSDPALVEHLHGFAGYLTRDGRMDQARYHLLQHVLRTRHQLSLDVDQASLPALGRWMEKSNAVCFREDGSVRDPQGRILFDPTTGKADPQAQLPYPADSRARKQTTMAELTQRGIKPLEALPPVVGASEVEFRSADDAARRALALTITAVRGESLVANSPVSAGVLRERLPLGFDYLTPGEKALMSDGSERPNRQAAVQAAWRYEAAATLFWALGAHGDLPFPSDTCSPTELNKFVLSLDAPRFVSQAKFRPATDILNELDRSYRLHWVAVDTHQKGRQTHLAFDPGVVMERHYALNWLTRYEDAGWDDVTTPT